MYAGVSALVIISALGGKLAVVEMPYTRCVKYQNAQIVNNVKHLGWTVEITCIPDKPKKPTK